MQKATEKCSLQKGGIRKRENLTHIRFATGSSGAVTALQEDPKLRQRGQVFVTPYQ